MKKPTPADDLKAQLDKMALALIVEANGGEIADKVGVFKAVSTYYLGSTRWKKPDEEDENAGSFGAMRARIEDAGKGKK